MRALQSPNTLFLSSLLKLRIYRQKRSFICKQNIKNIIKKLVSNNAQKVDRNIDPVLDVYREHPSLKKMSKHELADLAKKLKIDVNKKLYNPISSFDQLQNEKTKNYYLRRFDKPTPLQSFLWPLMLKGRDVIAQSLIGTGKTTSIAYPLIEHCLANETISKIRAVVLVGNSNQAMDAYDKLSEVASLFDLKGSVFYGRMGAESHRRHLNRCNDYIVCTLGKFVTHLVTPTVDLSQISLVVMDNIETLTSNSFEIALSLYAKIFSKNTQLIFLFGRKSKVHYTAVLDICKNRKIVDLKVNFDDVEWLNDIDHEIIFTSISLKFQKMVQFLKKQVEDNKMILILSNSWIKCQILSNKIRDLGYINAILRVDLEESTTRVAKNCQIFITNPGYVDGLNTSKVDIMYFYDIPGSYSTFTSAFGHVKNSQRGRKVYTIFTKKDAHFAKKLKKFLIKCEKPVPVALEMIVKEVEKDEKFC